MEKYKLTLGQKIKKYIWKNLIYNLFPWFQSHFMKWHLVWHEKGRQPYHIGWLAPGKTLKDLKSHLRERWNFGNHFVAWTDNGQVLSWRKLDGFDYQYHIRVFKDGEIRGHYEYTPESKPVAHFTEINEQARIDEFKNFLEGYVIEKKYISFLEPDVTAAPESEIIIDSSLKEGK